ncbi:MAG: aspartyl-phosphate phosphatase Spo0E family protein [Alicyclobacillaceae bacterium]|nr:aspartyl-phosphate phosphatase Spo0E family protein [Alicyclobacillaceae bacterium]
MLALTDQIHQLQAELVDLFGRCNGRLTDPLLVRKSQQLDRLVVIAQRIRLQQEKKKRSAT